LRLNAVKAEPFAAGKVAGNLASGIVPEVNCVAFNAVKLLPLFATMFPLESSMTALDAGKVTKTSLVPAEKFTAESLLDDEIIVVLAKVPAPTVPKSYFKLTVCLITNCIISCICISNR
jgi:hypothetical protein